MKNFEEYVRTIEIHANNALKGGEVTLDRPGINKLLNGAVGMELRHRVSLADRQFIGAFFTGENLRSRALGPRLCRNIAGPIWDPACGAGDLLLSYSEKLPILPDIGKTLISWGKKLRGNDIEDVFLRAAKARLVLLAYSKGARNLTNAALCLRDVFPGIRRENSLLISPNFVPAEVVLNPPFISIQAPETCEWGRGNVSAAALFVDTCLRTTKVGTSIVAILPDVLRTGSRYERWRQFVLELAVIKRIDVYGTFDPQADVDVFILELEVRKKRIATIRNEGTWGVEQTLVGGKLEDYCSVSVGPVVPHRHKETGEEYPYLHSKDALPWGIVKHLTARRKFSGTTFQPPFVVIRRTSSPNDAFRALGTLINCSEPIAVENHLIVCKPHDGTVKTCKAILNILKSSATNEWLNNRIRCRHLTVGSVKEIPCEL